MIFSQKFGTRVFNNLTAISLEGIELIAIFIIFFLGMYNRRFLNDHKKYLKKRLLFSFKWIFLNCFVVNVLFLSSLRFISKSEALNKEFISDQVHLVNHESEFCYNFSNPLYFFLHFFLFVFVSVSVFLIFLVFLRDHSSSCR